MPGSNGGERFKGVNTYAQRMLTVCTSVLPEMNPDSADPYIFSTHSLPGDQRFLPPLTNGTLGWRVFGEIMHKGGVYNGEVGACHRADIPCPLAVRMKVGEGKHTYTLDAHTGIAVGKLYLRCILIINSYYYYY